MIFHITRLLYSNNDLETVKLCRVVFCVLYILLLIYIYIYIYIYNMSIVSFDDILATRFVLYL
jgi:hypothetical protein